MGFAKKEYEFLGEIGIEARNPGCFVNGVWKGNGPLVSSLNPSTNQVLTCSSSVSCFNILICLIFNLIEIRVRPKLHWLLVKLVKISLWGLVKNHLFSRAE